MQKWKRMTIICAVLTVIGLIGFLISADIIFVLLMLICGFCMIWGGAHMIDIYNKNKNKDGADTQLNAGIESEAEKMHGSQVEIKTNDKKTGNSEKEIKGSGTYSLLEESI